MNTCSICLEEGKLKNCTKCKNAVYCDNCLNNLHEKGIDNLCSVCRQDNWKPKFKKNKIKKTNKIKPIENISDTGDENDIIYVEFNCNKRSCCESIQCTLNIFKIITLSFGIGVITLYAINPNNDFILRFLWTSIIIGLLEMCTLFICVNCCIKKCIID